MMLVVAISRLDGIDRRALAGMQHHKKLAFPVGDGSKFKTAKVEFVYVTTPHNNQELIDAVLSLHRKHRDGSCVTDDEHYPCETVRILSGE